MTLATKNGSLIVKDGKLAENCGCCNNCESVRYAKFEWIDDPPPSTYSVPFSGDAPQMNFRRGLCPYYWKNGIPLAKPLLPSTPCTYTGPIPVGGVTHGRIYGNDFGFFSNQEYKLSLVYKELAGTASGPLALVADATDDLGRVSGKYFTTAFPFVPFLGVSKTELRINLFGSADELVGGRLIGTHSASSAAGVLFEGQTIFVDDGLNGYFGQGSHRYKISSATWPETQSLFDSLQGVSLKDANGTFLAQPDKPWSIQIDAPAMTALSAGLGDVVPFVMPAWSHEFVANQLITSEGGRPLAWLYQSTSARPNQFMEPPTDDVRFSGRLFMWPYTNDQTGGSPGCASGCQTRFALYGSLEYLVVTERTQAETKWRVAYLFISTITDCFDSVSNATSSVSISSISFGDNSSGGGLLGRRSYGTSDLSSISAVVSV
jgi:hypothetical protein